MEIADPGIGITVVVLGGLLVVAGIALLLILLREGRWWENMLMGMLGMELPDFGLGGMMPMMQQMIQGLLKRVFTYVRLIALIGGTGVSTIGVVLIILGLYIWF